MADHLKLYIFGDQIFDIQPYLRTLLHKRDNPILEDFLVKSYDVVRVAMFTLPVQVREDLPRFTCLDDLILWSQNGQRCIPLDMAVTCIYQLGAFICQADADTWQAGTDKPRILGLCTGALAAAAVSCSRSLLELVPLAVEAVAVAFRTGVLVSEVAKRVAPLAGQEADLSWSILVASSASSQIVEEFCKQTLLPLTSRPYIGAYAPNGITVSGPPATLAQLTSSEFFSGLRFKSVPVYAPYHAPHLYSPDDTRDVVGVVASGCEHLPLFSSTKSKPKEHTFDSLLAAAVGQILLEPIRWSVVLEELQTWLQDAAPKSFSAIPIGTTADQLIYTSLKHTPLENLVPTLKAHAKSADQHISSGNPKQPKLAIIAMSGRFPAGQDIEAFWDLLYKGLDVAKPVPALHWDAKTHVDPTGKTKNTSATPFGCWLDDPAAFDARFFNISPREAPQIDPAQRLALMTAYEAIEQAGIVPDATPSTRRDRVGVFYGVTSNDWMETNSAQDIDTYFIPGGNRAFIPGRINYCFKFSGPSFAVDTACSSSLAGIHIACNSLWRGDIDTAIAGGTNVLTNPDMTAGLDRGHFLSRTGNCKTFDDEADGYCRGEGVGTIIIKRLDDAIADKDPILGVILGAYTNHSAKSESITRPHVGAQQAIFSKILNQGAVDPYSVSYVEMHGTGTQAGDASEMSSVLHTFAPPLSQVKKGRTIEESVFLGSVKSNIGHGEASSGVVALIKVLLMMQKNMIPPHCGIKSKINSKFPTDLKERNVKIALKPTAWKRSFDPSKPRRAFVNNFSAAGGNSSLLIEDAPVERPTEGSDLRSIQLVAVSAKTGSSLQGNLRSLLQFLKQSPDVNIGQLSYTTTARRMHHHHRVMIAGSNVQEISTQIEKSLQENCGMARPKAAPKILFTFTGQGAQYPGMGKQLFENFSFFNTEIRRLDQIAQGLGFPSILPLIQSEEQDISIFAPIVVQLGSVCFQIALAKLWKSWNITPIAVVGHSLGEYAALNTAGVLSDTDTIYMVGMRATLLQEKCTRDTHAMLVVKGSVDEIAAVLKDKEYETACINSPIETVLAGLSDEISTFKELLTVSGMKSTLLKVPYAFHSSQLEPILSEFIKAATGVTFYKPQVPVLCPFDGSIVTDIGKFGPEYLASHSRQPVNMLKALKTARSDKITTDLSVFIEIGPHPAVSGMVRAVLGPQVASVASLQRGRPTWLILVTALKLLYTVGAEICWAEIHRDFTASHKVVKIPAYSWDLKPYWIQYVNDWSLRKGELPLTITSSASLESTTIHRVVEETGDSQKTRIIVEADITRKDLAPLVQGHEVNGIPLCTPSVYGDISLTLGTYLLKKYLLDQQDNVVDVSNMIISKALILKEGATQQFLQVHAEVDWSLKSAAIKFMSCDSKQKLQEHSRCTVCFRDKSVQTQLQKDAQDVKQKIQALTDGIATGTAFRFNRAMVYRAIRPLARFHDDYRAIDEIVLNSNTLECLSYLSFGSVNMSGNYHTHPAIIDSLTQSCGFTMNCNDSTDLDVEVFMNHGWGAFQMFAPMDPKKKYVTYTQMKEGKDKLWYGDVYVFDGEEVVAFFGQIAIQGVPRRVLGVILSIEAGQKSHPQKSQTATTKQPKIGASDRPETIIKTTRASTPVIRESHAAKVTKALEIIAEESGLGIEDLTDSIVFGDVGIDSLLSLTIAARFTEELDIDLDFNALFNDYPSVAKLKAFLGKNGPDAALSSPSTSASATESSSPMSKAIGITTPDEESLGASKADFQRALNIITEESGVVTEDLTDDTNFADFGIDSLLSLVIVSRFRDELQFDIQHESLFLECPTLADLRRLLCADAKASEPIPVFNLETVEVPVEQTISAQRSEADKAALVVRRSAVDELVAKYTAGWSAPDPSSSATAPGRDDKVILVTGASGSLGGHLVYHLAQLPHIKQIVCLNRENKTEPYTRQQKAMREKGIRFPESLKPKLFVLQTDSAKPMFGLTKSEYDGLTTSVTHLIHNAWPMSAKRPLAGFESQFQVMRNLIDFSCDVVAHRPASFKFSFQQVSSVGVVGLYNIEKHETRTIVPEDRVDIDSVLPNGYGEAKWGCERMLDETLHTHPYLFRPMVVRLGQIAGSKTSGYWNPMEHFGFLIKSSQTLNALPDVDGTVFWTPVNDIAGTLSDLILMDQQPYPIYHIENPVGQSWKETNAILADALKIPNLIPFKEWCERVRNAPQRNNPASTLLEFLDSNYLRMSCGGLVLDVKKTLAHSKTLAAVGPVSEEVVRKYIHIWKEIGFLNN